MADAAINTADILAVDEELARTTGAQGYGLTDGGFVPKPFARLLAEKLALARTVFGSDVDLTSGSAIRKILEVTALEDARTWAALAAMYDNQFVSSARGEALSRLGEELGLPRPFLQAQGTIRLTPTLPDGLDELLIPRGARLFTGGNHHVATTESVILTRAGGPKDVAVEAFYPGPEHNLDPNVSEAGGNPQKIAFWNRDDLKLAALKKAAGTDPLESVVGIAHTRALAGGELRWPDTRYRELLLRAPRSTWSVEAIRVAASLVPGVRRVVVRDGGGLDIDLPIFGTFNFGERVFGAERDIVSPNFFSVLLALSTRRNLRGTGGRARLGRVGDRGPAPDRHLPARAGGEPRVRRHRLRSGGDRDTAAAHGVRRHQRFRRREEFQASAARPGPALRRHARFRRAGAFLRGHLCAHGRTRPCRRAQPEAAPFAAAPGRGERARRARLQRVAARREPDRGGERDRHVRR